MRFWNRLSMYLNDKILKHLKARIIEYIDDHYPEACWAYLVHWELGNYSTKEMFLEGLWNWQICNNEIGYYCGKCEKKS